LIIELKLGVKDIIKTQPQSRSRSQSQSGLMTKIRYQMRKITTPIEELERPRMFSLRMGFLLWQQ
ncbi:hypothetical protein, partial [Arachidicoccus sp.]|uniref:hypothetical protein n=1 Tax=Arachidicoccus sp. TaxID=1872624 RepID=UPI003D22D3A3